MMVLPKRSSFESSEQLEDDHDGLRQ